MSKNEKKLIIKQAAEHIERARKILESAEVDWSRIGANLESDKFIDLAYDGLGLAESRLSRAILLVHNNK